MTDSNPDFTALEIADFIFGGGSLSSRLGNRVRQREGLSYGVRSHFHADARDPMARFLVAAICNPANMDKVDKAISEELAKLLKQGIGEKELAEAKAAYLKQAKVLRARDETLAAILADELFNERTFAYYSELENKIASLTPDQVNAAVRKHIDPAKLVVIHAGDFKKQATN